MRPVPVTLVLSLRPVPAHASAHGPHTAVPWPAPRLRTDAGTPLPQIVLVLSKAFGAARPSSRRPRGTFPVDRLAPGDYTLAPRARAWSCS